MSINEKNKRLMSVVQLSQWKIVPKPNEPDGDIPIAQNRNGQGNHQLRQDTGQRLLRDANAFYRNDTSSFLGELQKAETQLYQKTVNLIDFFPSNRKAPRKETLGKPQGRGIDSLLSDGNIVSIPRAGQKSRKNDEPEKLIVDVSDFVASFSAFREPVYLQGTRKNEPKPEVKSEVECFLDQTQLRRENDNPRETHELMSDATGHHMPGGTAESMENSSNHPVPGEDVVPVVDRSVREDLTHNQTTLDCRVGQECPGQLIVNTWTISPLNEDRDLPTHEAGYHTDEQDIPPAVIPAKVEVKEATTETLEEAAPDPVLEVKISAYGDQINVTVVNETNADDAIKPRPVVPKLPGILERMEEFAGGECDSLAEYIKDKVYDGSRLIAFCGMKRRAGCSTMTLLAARGITRHGLKTAVIDANFEFPQLNAMVTGQWKERESWVNVLHGTLDWETQGITSKDMPLLTIFPLAENALAHWSQHEPERLQQETNRLISTLQEHFDLILLDCGCFEGAFEEITWGELALFQPDSAILVHNPKDTPFDVLKHCCREILGSGITTCGVTENFV